MGFNIESNDLGLWSWTSVGPVDHEKCGRGVGTPTGSVTGCWHAEPSSSSVHLRIAGR